MIVAVSLLQLNLTIQRRSRTHVENSPPPEKLNSNKKSLARNIFILKTTKRKAVPALLRYPKLFARYSLRTILTATPTHTPCFRHRRRSCSLPSSKRGTPPFKICYISKSFAPREATGFWELESGIYTLHFAFIIASQTLNLPLAISNLPFCSPLASSIWHLHFALRIPYFALDLPLAISNFPL